ncbi:hypothetical protein INS49_006586 [Diaporthe citri]|uniref:uncharacterized protein n=1 Tax=Diaporthe citri TaxID=83186 RepID=UPI001C80AEE5|nr:uncharacterized protein INS49_006586 [Diaporthe citri]KAG6364981.1 hypothetical protein INS49_006586 [Diaporthe citri]
MSLPIDLKRSLRSTIYLAPTEYFDLWLRALAVANLAVANRSSPPPPPAQHPVLEVV